MNEVVPLRPQLYAHPPVGVRSLEMNRLEGALGMKKAVLALTTAATIVVTVLAIPSPAEARWRGGGWGGITFDGYAYGPGYYGDPGYTYIGRYAPPYGYGGSPLITGYVPNILYSSSVRPPPYHGGYTRSYAPAFDGPRNSRRVRPAYGYW
jgi:hypothetical protein